MIALSPCMAVSSMAALRGEAFAPGQGEVKAYVCE